MSLNDKILEQKKAARKVADHTKESKGGGVKIPEKGVCYARLVSYVELGEQPKMYEGKSVGVKPMVNLAFECYGKKNRDEIEVDGKKKTLYRLLTVNNLQISTNAKAKFFKMFNDMRAGRDDILVMGEMLNEVFKITIEHNEHKGRTYANIKAITGPFKEVETEDGDIELQDMTNSCPPASRDFQFFLFDAPTLDMWNTIHIKGEREVEEENEDGTKVKVKKSKNFLQDTIVQAHNFPGSDLEALLADVADEEMEGEVEEDDLEEEEEEKPAPKKKKAPAKKAAKKEAEVEDIDIDDLFEDEE